MIVPSQNHWSQMLDNKICSNLWQNNFFKQSLWLLKDIKLSFMIKHCVFYDINCHLFILLSSIISTTSAPLPLAEPRGLIWNLVASVALLLSVMLMACWCYWSIEFGQLQTLFVLLCDGTGAVIRCTLSAATFVEGWTWGRSGSMVALGDTIAICDEVADSSLTLPAAVQKSTRLSLLSRARRFWNQIFTCEKYSKSLQFWMITMTQLYWQS